MSGQCFLIPACTRAKRSGSEDGVSSSFRTWMWASVAPASKAWYVDSICSDGRIGTAGLSFLRGTEPVMGTATTTGFILQHPIECAHAPQIQIGSLSMHWGPAAANIVDRGGSCLYHTVRS